MTLRTVAIRLKIPDNAAHTALAALLRLGVQAERLERADIWQLEDSGDGDFIQRFESNESLFNPNKHVLRLLESSQPRAGEVWIEESGAGEIALRMNGTSHARRFTSWRLFAPSGDPAPPASVRDAAEKLLCNPAIERAIYS